MSNRQRPTFSDDDADIVILHEQDGVIDTTHRPVSEATRKRIQERLAKEAELRRMAEELRKDQAKQPPQKAKRAADLE